MKEVRKAYSIASRLGPMAILCRGETILGSLLPCERLDILQEQVQKLWQLSIESESPPLVGELERRLTDLWRGVPDSFLDLELDLSAFTPFQQEVYASIRRLKPAEVWTYGQVAASLGAPKAARAVGGALRVNPIPLFIPCHRVLAKAGMGGFTAPRGLAQKYDLLRAEGWSA